ncbi:uncharacterized protein LOC131332371 [Rhododendron vialii]|uniref:uncharacterized protein LOC131332371 n=1 Tax=Rhododendron vialii TaxID=182163 RepID=UPI00265E7E52|nr:uncharacterized protein LOC131332371 [Rhododendron vialii]
MAGICCYGSTHPTLGHSMKSDFHKKRVLSLQCRSTAPTNSNSKRPNPTPPLLKLAVTGLTELLRIFSSGSGRLDTEYSVEENEVPVSNIDDVVMTLKLDYENSYFVTGIFTSAIYLEDCLFEDPTIKFRGTKLYSRNLKLLVPFFDSPSIVLKKIEKAAALLPPFSFHVPDKERRERRRLEIEPEEDRRPTTTKDCNSETSFVSATWKLRTFLRLPWRPLISVNGSTVYELDDNFRIVRHAESWDISALQAIGQIFTPSFLVHR